MKISDLIAYLQKYQVEFGDVDVELNLDGAKIGPDGKVPVKTLAPIPQTKDEVDKAFILKQELSDIFHVPWDKWNDPYFIPTDPPINKKNFSWRDAEENIKKSPFYSNIVIDKKIYNDFNKHFNVINKYFNNPIPKP